MFNKRISIFITSLFISSILIGVFSNIQSIAQAATVYQQTCAIKVFPFNEAEPTESLLQEGNRHLNAIPDEFCNTHLSYTQTNNYRAERPYTNPQPPSEEENQIKPGSENIKVPVGLHEHAFYNDSRSEGRFYHKAFLRSFEITVFLDDDGDGNLNVDADRLVCDMPTPRGANNGLIQEELQDCQTSSPLPIYNGTTLTRQNLADRVIIRWEMGTNGRPPQAMYGINNENFVAYDLDDTNRPFALENDFFNNPYERTLGENGSGFAVHVRSTENLPYTTWSATTISKARIVNAQIPVATYNGITATTALCRENGWCMTESIDGHWVPVGSVASVWKKPASEIITPSETRLRLQKQVNLVDGRVIIQGTPADDFTLYAELSSQPADRRRPNSSTDRRRPVGTPGGRSAIDLITGGKTTEMSFASGERINFENGQEITVAAGTYRVDEEPKEGFRKVRTLCEGQATDRVTLAEGESKSCLIINEEIPEEEGEEEECPPGERLEGGQCVPIQEEEECPPEEQNERGECLPPITVPECPPGQEREDGQCIPTQQDQTVCVLINGTPTFVRPYEAAGLPACFTNSGGGGGGGSGSFFNPPAVSIPAATFAKVAHTRGGSGNVIRLWEFVDYQLDFSAIRFVNFAQIRDSSFRFNGNSYVLTGSEGGKLMLIASDNNRLFTVWKQTNAGRFELPVCNNGEATVPGSSYGSCYQGIPFSAEGVRVTNIGSSEKISIQFSAQLVASPVEQDRNFCKNKLRDIQGFCGEFFENTATAVDSEGRAYTAGQKLYTPCPFLLTRGLGDIILESNFTYGTDIFSCAGLPNIEGEIIQPIPDIPEQEVPKFGPDSEQTPLEPTHEICKRSNTNDSSIPKEYRNPFDRLSSGLCELQQSISNDLTRSAIEKGVTDNVTRLTREQANLGTNGRRLTGEYINEVPEVILSNTNYKVYKVKGNLTIEAAASVKAGSRTFIVEGGDLVITSNIAFDKQAVQNAAFKDTPSIAFIVIGGDIKVANGVERLDGVFVSIKDQNGKGGKINGASSEPSNRPLAINGVVVGDIQPLFENRTFVGDARRNQGTIVITYGAWLYYNIPPVLRELVDLQQVQTAR